VFSTQASKLCATALLWHWLAACLHRAQYVFPVTGSTQPMSPGLASSSTGRNSRAEGPNFRNCGGVFDRLVEIWARNRGHFDQFSRQNTFARPQRPPEGQLVEIGQGTSTSWSKSPRGACEPCMSLSWHSVLACAQHSLTIRQRVPRVHLPCVECLSVRVHQLGGVKVGSSKRHVQRSQLATRHLRSMRRRASIMLAIQQ
jgi:hypothetical protein